ncbi:MAG: DUF4838 domain-containing protein [Planctomycetota bacterium]|nr:DUF4838 domain-containing protein [Planctomycetota bacterium]
MNLARRLCLLLLVAASLRPASLRAGEFASVLTDNAVGDEAAIETGVAYTAEPAFENPVDTAGRRLLDRDLPMSDWNTCAGINKPEQTLTFDMKREYRFSRFAAWFTRPAKPASIECSVAATLAGPWVPAGTITPVDGWNELKPATPVAGRFVRMRFKIKEWGWYINEVKFWGTRADEPGLEAKLPLVREGSGLALVKEGKPVASVIVAADAPPRLLKEARFLQKTIEQMSGAVLPVRDDSRDWEGGQILVGPSKLNTLAFEQGEEKPQGYRLVVGKNRIAIAGNDADPMTGTNYAVYDLLEKLGCGWFGPDPLYQVVPRRATLVVADEDRTERPAMAMREVWNVPADIRPAWRLGGTKVHSGHAYADILPPAKHWATHPEYYSLVDGKRTQGGQVCFTNPEVQRLTLESCREFFKAHPDAMAVSLSPNDRGGFCECDACTKTGGNPGERTLAFCNVVAKGLAESNPGKCVTFLAYWYTFAAPVNGTKAEPNVIVQIVKQGCHAHAFDDAHCAINVGQSRNLEAWGRIGAKLSIYEWYIPGCSRAEWKKLPWVASDVAYRDVRYWRAHGVQWITYESQTAYESGTGYPRRWPLYYLAARAMWNPDEDPNAVMRDASDKLYGPAGRTMAEYFRVVADTMEQTQSHGSIWNMPPAENIFRAEVTAKLRKLLSRAMEEAAADTGSWQRVAAEAGAWREGEQALAGLPPFKLHPVDALDYNGGIWFTDQDRLKGVDVRDLIGIGAGENVMVRPPGGEWRKLVDTEVYPSANGLVLKREGK